MSANSDPPQEDGSHRRRWYAGHGEFLSHAHDFTSALRNAVTTPVSDTAWPDAGQRNSFGRRTAAAERRAHQQGFEGPAPTKILDRNPQVSFHKPMLTEAVVKTKRACFCAQTGAK
jgi:hypothetical protein